MMEMDWSGFILGIFGLLVGGGISWIFTVKAIKRKADGESQLVVADSWKSVQDVYQQTIEDLNKYCDDIRKDRNNLREERDQHKQETENMRKKYIAMEDQIIDLKKAIARQGRKIEALSPFLCGVVGCINRTKVELKEETYEEEELNKVSDAV